MSGQQAEGDDEDKGKEAVMDGNELMFQEEVKDVQEKRLIGFNQHLKHVENDMYQAWNYLPQRMAGNYKQCVPNPSLETQFIMVQPEVIEDKSTSYIIGKVDNPK